MNRRLDAIVELAFVGRMVDDVEDSLEEAVRRRLRLLDLVEQGWSIRAAAKEVGLGRGAYRPTKRSVDEGGETLLRRRLAVRRGKSGWSDRELAEALRAALAEHPTYAFAPVLSLVRRRGGPVPTRHARSVWRACDLDRQRAKPLRPRRSLPVARQQSIAPTPASIDEHVLLRVRLVELVDAGSSVSAAARRLGVTRRIYDGARRALLEGGIHRLRRLVVRTVGRPFVARALAELRAQHPAWGEVRLRRALMHQGVPAGRKMVKMVLAELRRRTPAEIGRSHAA